MCVFLAPLVAPNGIVICLFDQADLFETCLKCNIQLLNISKEHLGRRLLKTSIS